MSPRGQVVLICTRCAKRDAGVAAATIAPPTARLPHHHTDWVAVECLAPEPNDMD